MFIDEAGIALHFCKSPLFGIPCIIKYPVSHLCLCDPSGRLQSSLPRWRESSNTRWTDVDRCGERRGAHCSSKELLWDQRMAEWTGQSDHSSTTFTLQIYSVQVWKLGGNLAVTWEILMWLLEKKNWTHDRWLSPASTWRCRPSTDVEEQEGNQNASPPLPCSRDSNCGLRMINNYAN